MRNWNRILPYISLGLATVITFVLSQVIENTEIKNILVSVFSNALFFFLVYLFYDLIRQMVFNKEKQYLINYIKNEISNDIFVALYFLKKIIHGYNLDTNTPDNILNIVNYSKNEILNSVKNQNYLGFQIFKNTDEVRSLFNDAISDNLILKYSSHIDSINILRIANNLVYLESMLKNKSNFNKCGEGGIEFTVVNGKSINPENDEKYLLMKKTAYSDRFVVYDSGYFEQNDIKDLLSRYVFKKEPTRKIASLLAEIFVLMKHWLPDVTRLYKNEDRFRIVKNFFCPSTNSKTKKSKIYVADIVKIGK
ncbi:MAG: hypothetical protein PHW62_06355 [Candidatus Ratteibacteria bacterium]|nr:hypothetical protein [Candidatus Ratteibacteria bacterium]